MNQLIAAKRRRGFTYVELIAVMAIILLLITMLLPTFLGARESARATNCRSNLMQLSTALHLYAQDYNGRFPPSDGPGLLALERYTKNRGVLSCSSEPREVSKHYRVGRTLQLPDKREVMQSSYLYRGGLSSDDPAETPLARDWGAWHAGGMDVLYLGGWTKWERYGDRMLPGTRLDPPAAAVDVTR